MYTAEPNNSKRVTQAKVSPQCLALRLFSTGNFSVKIDRITRLSIPKITYSIISATRLKVISKKSM